MTPASREAEGRRGGRPQLLPRAFYARDTLLVARDLIGKVLVHRTPRGRASGVIVEAEAYIGEEDPACHAAAGRTPRNAPLYGPPGFAYVYFNYGMHYLVNAVTEAEGQPAAVLLRALAPLEGIDAMRARRASRRQGPRPTTSDEGLCRGPGNLTCALGITRDENEADLCGTRLAIEDWGIDPGTIAWSPRIGIRVGTEQWWRVFVRGHGAVSGPRLLHETAAEAPRTFSWASGPRRRRVGPRPRGA